MTMSQCSTSNPVGFKRVFHSRRDDLAIQDYSTNAGPDGPSRQYRLLKAIFELGNFVEAHQVIEVGERIQVRRAFLGIAMLFKRTVDFAQSVAVGKKAR